MIKPKARLLIQLVLVKDGSSLCSTENNINASTVLDLSTNALENYANLAWIQFPKDKFTRQHGNALSPKRPNSPRSRKP